MTPIRLPTRSSRAHSMLRCGLGGAALVLTLLVGCATPGGDAFRPPEGALADRAWQIRRFEGLTEPEMLRACAGVLQDLGFMLEETESRLGLIVATKDRSARKVQTKAESVVQTSAEVALSIALTLLTRQLIVVGGGELERQVIRTSLFAQPDATTPRTFTVRVMFQRVVYRKDGRVASAETLMDAALAQAFFDALSKSTFLEAQHI